MKKPEAMSISIGVLGGLDVYLTATAIKVPVWVTFIAWASFFIVGGGRQGWKRSLACNVTGIIIASLSLLAIELAGGGPLAAAIFVGIGSAGMVQATKLPFTGITPAIVWGFASTVGTMVATGKPITTASFSNPALVAAVAMVIGASFGFLSELWGEMMTSKAAAEAVPTAEKLAKGA
jgi:Protein of unknown function (DUF1097)